MDEDTLKICLELVDPDDEVMMQRKIEALESITNLFDDSCDGELSQLETQEMYDCLVNAFKIVETNMFRVLPPSQRDPSFLLVGPAFKKIDDEDDDDPVESGLNPLVLNKVCDLLYTLLHFEYQGTDVSFFIDDNFLDSLLGLIQSEQRDERDLISTNVATIYKRFPSHRTKIEMLLTSYINRIAAEPTRFYIYIENLLWILVSLLEEIDDNAEQEQERRTNLHNKFYRPLLYLHRVPYKYYFYLPLFRCLQHFLRWEPNNICPFVRTIIGYSRRPAPPNSRPRVNDTSSEMLYLIELEMVLRVTCRLESSLAATIFSQIYISIIDHLGRALSSLKTELVLRSIAILVSQFAQPLLEPYWGEVAKMLLPILESPDHLVAWDPTCLYQQTLLAIHLKDKTTRLVPSSTSP